MKLFSERIVVEHKGYHYIRNIDSIRYDWGRVFTWKGPYNLNFASSIEKIDSILAEVPDFIWEKTENTSSENWSVSTNGGYHFDTLSDMPELEQLYIKMQREDKIKRLLKTNEE